MVDQGGEFNIFQGIHVRTNIKIDISIFIRPMTTKFDKQVHLREVTQTRQIKQVLVTSFDKLKPLYLHYHSAYKHQTSQVGD